MWHHAGHTPLQQKGNRKGTVKPLKSSEDRANAGFRWERETQRRKHWKQNLDRLTITPSLTIRGEK